MQESRNGATRIFGLTMSRKSEVLLHITGRASCWELEAVHRIRMRGPGKKFKCSRSSVLQATCVSPQVGLRPAKGRDANPMEAFGRADADGDATERTNVQA
jgi:hypothetical protein